MSIKNNDRSAALAKRLQEISTELKSMGKEFKTLAKRSKSAVKSAHLRSDDKKLLAIRKKMGLK
ncbi:MAG: hypothetical protein WC551_06815 [Patescibacteria group bacterium]